MDYSYYRAGNYFKNRQVALPYGTTDSENVISATATRQLTKSMHLLFKYTYSDYANQTSGGNNNYRGTRSTPPAIPILISDIAVSVVAMKVRRRIRMIVLAGLLAAFAAGCDRRRRENHGLPAWSKAPLESPPAAKTDATDDAARLASEQCDAGASAAPQGVVPANWEAQPPSQMRQASYIVHGENGASAGHLISHSRGHLRNVLDNVNRWLGQLGQSPITERTIAGGRATSSGQSRPRGRR